MNHASIASRSPLTSSAENRQSATRVFLAFGVLLGSMAALDWYFSHRLMAEVQKVEADRISHLPAINLDVNGSGRGSDGDLIPVVAAAQSPAEESASESEKSDESVHMVEQALNSRYMQWGAVGVMLALFVWIVTKHAPAQEKRRDAERKEEREAYLESLRQRDELYLDQIREIRGSVETHTRDVIASKDRLAGALQDLRVTLAKGSGKD